MCAVVGFVRRWIQKEGLCVFICEIYIYIFNSLSSTTINY